MMWVTKIKIKNETIFDMVSPNDNKCQYNITICLLIAVDWWSE